MRIETSLITSLDELRALHNERIADERAAIERSKRAEIEARHAAEQTRIAAEQARLAAERDERLRAEQAHALAEREIRLRVEATEAAERARHAAALEQQRLEEEIALRRAEVAQKRPTWMIAVTALALVAAIALSWFAVQRGHQAEASTAAADAARRDKEEAIKAAQEARAELGRIEHSLGDLEVTVKKAQDRVVAAQTDADRKRAVEELREANRQKAEIQGKLDEKRRERERWIRLHPDKIDEKCLKSVLGCLEHH